MKQGFPCTTWCVTDESFVFHLIKLPVVRQDDNRIADLGDRVDTFSVGERRRLHLSRLQNDQLVTGIGDPNPSRSAAGT